MSIEYNRVAKQAMESVIEHIEKLSEKDDYKVVGNNCDTFTIYGDRYVIGVMFAHTTANNVSVFIKCVRKIKYLPIKITKYNFSFILFNNNRDFSSFVEKLKDIQNSYEWKSKSKILQQQIEVINSLGE